MIRPSSTTRRHNPGRLPITTERPFGLTAQCFLWRRGAAREHWPWRSLGLGWNPYGALPEARVGFARIGPWAIVLMIMVALACSGAAIGLWTGRRWGYRLAVGVLSCNLLGDLLNAVVRDDRPTLIGLPIGGAMLGYLLSRRIRDRFRFA
jgi:hypothetical protein